MKSFLYFLGLIFFFCSCNQKEKEAQVTNIALQGKAATIVSADNQFGFELFKKINSSLNESKNTMISPMSVSLALAMLYNGAEGQTKAQMEQVLHKEGLTPEDINQKYQELVKALVSHDPNVELSVANAIYYRNTFSVKNSFITTNQNYYQAEVQGLDFNKEAETIKTVNGWVNSNTKGKIDKIIDEVSPETIMYLMNAIYFNGQWKDKFDPVNTADMPFTKEDNQVIQVPTMKIRKSYNYCYNDHFQLLEMPYGSGKYSMLIFLPVEGKTTNDVIDFLNSDSLSGCMNRMHSLEKKVFLPKFEFRFGKSLENDLKALGMTDAFMDSKANLKGISEQAQLKVSEVKHVTYIKVDEKGTEAAAVTGVEVTVISDVQIGPYGPFKVDHPFVFAIREKDTHAILFIGKVMNPLEK